MTRQVGRQEENAFILLASEGVHKQTRTFRQQAPRPRIDRDAAQSALHDCAICPDLRRFARPRLHILPFRTNRQNRRILFAS